MAKKELTYPWIMEGGTVAFAAKMMDDLNAIKTAVNYLYENEFNIGIENVTGAGLIGAVIPEAGITATVQAILNFLYASKVASADILKIRRNANGSVEVTLNGTDWTAVDAVHVAKTDNPHNVTPTQLNVYTKAETYGKSETYPQSALYTKTEVQTSGQAAVHWGNLTNIPNLADSHWKAAVANQAALPSTGNALSDQRVVLDDGDGKSAVYLCVAITGTIAEQWDKIGDVDWATEEATRVTQELARVSADGLRTTAESGRATAEGLRVTAESGRVTVELARVSAEGLRVIAESGRVNAENIRSSAEGARVLSESGRGTAEGLRVIAESGRDTTNTNLQKWEAYNGVTAYVPLNKVVYNGSSYVNKVGCTGVLPTDASKWLLIASKGADGIGAGDMIASVYDPIIAAKVDDEQVLTNVPAGAVFTDTLPTAVNIGTLISDATTKATPADTDQVGLMDSAASNVLKKLSWANIKSAIGTYYNTLTATMTNKTLTTPVITSVKTPTNTFTFPTTTDTAVGRNTTDTLTNKRLIQRVNTITSAATITPIGDTSDMYTVTALAVGATIAAPSGSPTNGQEIMLRILDNGTARNLTWNAIYREAGAELPTVTEQGKTMYLLFKYNTAQSKWDLIEIDIEGVNLIEKWVSTKGVDFMDVRNLRRLV